MTIKIRNINIDEDDSTHFWFQIHGPDSTNGTVRIAVVDETGQLPEDWLAANLAAAQIMIDGGDTAGTFTAKQEAKNFLADNPSAEALIGLGPNDLELAIEGRTAAQEDLLLKTLSFAVRFLYASLQED
jgi:hypothetical protein